MLNRDISFWKCILQTITKLLNGGALRGVDTLQRDFLLIERYNDEMKIFNTLLSAKNGTVIRDSRKADVKQYWEDNQAGKPLDPYDYADLTMYLATVKTVNKTKGAMRNACLSGDAAKCEQMINDNSKTITGPMAREWENLILEGGIELDERHRKTFENMGK